MKEENKEINLEELIETIKQELYEEDISLKSKIDETGTPVIEVRKGKEVKEFVIYRMDIEELKRRILY